MHGGWQRKQRLTAKEERVREPGNSSVVTWVLSHLSILSCHRFEVTIHLRVTEVRFRFPPETGAFSELPSSPW